MDCTQETEVAVTREMTSETHCETQAGLTLQICIESQTPLSNATHSSGYSHDSVFSPQLQNCSDAHDTVNRLQKKVNELEKELYRRRISLNLCDPPSPLFFNSTPNPIERSISVPTFWKEEEVARMQTEIAALRLAKEQKEATHVMELSACLEENSRLRAELNVARNYKRDAEKAAELEREVNEKTEKLEREIEENKRKSSEIDTLKGEKAAIIRQIKLLESEVECEKQNSSQIQQSTSETMRQLIASKSLCECDLSTLQEKHLRLISDSTKVEMNLRTIVEELKEECRKLREKKEEPQDCEELRKQVEDKEREFASLLTQVGSLEDKLILVSTQLASERKRHFEVENVLSQENEVLKSEMEDLRKRTESEVRDFEALQQQLSLSEVRLQGETRLHAEIDSLKEMTHQRDLEIRKLLVTIEEMKINERVTETKLVSAETTLRERTEAAKSEETELIARLTREKNEAERTVFEEIEKRAKAEERCFAFDSAIRKMEEDNAQLRAIITVKERELAKRDIAKRRSFQIFSSNKDSCSPLKPQATSNCPPLAINEVCESTLQVTETRALSIPDPAKSPETHVRSLKDSLSNSPCNCVLW